MAEMNSGLDTLAARLQEDLANLCYPPKNWVPRQDAGGEPVTDVAIIGGGNSAVEAALDLYRHGAKVSMIVKGSNLKKIIAMLKSKMIEHIKIYWERENVS